MQIKTNIYIILIMSIFCTLVNGQDNIDQTISKIKNNKEIYSQILKTRKAKKALRNFIVREEDQIQEKFDNNMREFLNSKNRCSFSFTESFHNTLKIQNIVENLEQTEAIFYSLRSNNSIDDILLEILLNDIEDLRKLKSDMISEKPPKGKIRFNKAEKKAFNKINLNNLFGIFKKLPDNKEICLLNAYAMTAGQLQRFHRENVTKNINKLALKAYREDIITKEVYKKFKYLGESKGFNNHLSMRGYFEVLEKSKDILNKDENELLNVKAYKFSETKIKRLKKLTNRARLYKRYRHKEIIILAQILERASLRMGVDKNYESSQPFIHQEFVSKISDEVITDDYYFDPQRQYNYARWRMKDDMVKKNAMSIFAKNQITYEDIVMASLETGYITHEDLASVLEYDDLWSKELTGWQKIRNFSMSIVGTAVFYLPPPFNIVGSIAVAVTQTVISKKQNKGARNAHSAKIFY